MAWPGAPKQRPVACRPREPMWFYISFVPSLDFKQNPMLCPEVWELEDLFSFWGDFCECFPPPASDVSRCYILCTWSLVSFRSWRSKFEIFNCFLVAILRILGLWICLPWIGKPSLMTPGTVCVPLWDSKGPWNTWVWYWYHVLSATGLLWNPSVVRFVVSFSDNGTSDFEHEGTSSSVSMTERYWGGGGRKARYRRPDKLAGNCKHGGISSAFHVFIYLFFLSPG